MWFKQAQLFQLSDSLAFTQDFFTEKMEKLFFQPCLPSIPQGSGWISPLVSQDASLVQYINGRMMICLQIEEKILPPVVIRQELAKKIKQIEKLEDKKMGSRDKLSLKDEITSTLLLRAFSKLTQIYAYIDTKKRWLILGTANTKKTEQFLLAFKKTFGDCINSFQSEKLSGTMTAWLKNHYPSCFSIEKSCVLQDSNHESRVIRCKEQNLFASSIQSLIKDGCEIKQLALNWQDRIDFVLLDNLSLQSIRFKDEVIAQVKEMDAETKEQQFHADFIIMTETLNGLIIDLLNAFSLHSNSDNQITKHENALHMAKIA